MIVRINADAQIILYTPCPESLQDKVILSIVYNCNNVYKHIKKTILLTD